MTDNNGGGSANTVLISVIIVVIIAVAFYFGYARGHWGGEAANDNGGINVDLNLPDGGNDSGEAN